MRMRRQRQYLSLTLGVFSLLLLVLLCLPAWAGAPKSAFYAPATDKVFWFIQTSDVHVGASGTQDSSNLQWIVTTAKNVINPSFIVVTGDLTDSTNGNLFGYPNGPYQAEWTQYATILSNAGMDDTFYFDLPGNHDAYNDKDFVYYRGYSVQGKKTGSMQLSWTREFSFGKYHFLGINTADNTGNKFSLTWPYGDNAGLDSTERTYIASELSLNANAALTLVFGHHPIAPTGDSADTYLFYGKDEFVSYLDSYGASLYGYGHTHDFSEQFYSTNMTNGIFYFNVASLGKSSANQYTIMAIDCNGLSSAVQTIGTWPAVLITAPMNRQLGGVANPYAYNVPADTASPLRALVFDPNGISAVRYRIDGGSTWHDLSRVSSGQPLWNGTFDSSGLSIGVHTVEVQATGSATKSDTVTVYVEAQQPTQPPAAPGSLAATTVSSSQINLSWTDKSDNETGFKIERCQGSTCANFSQIAIVGANAITYQDTGVSAGTPYSYRVRAYNAVGDSGYSNAATATTLAAQALPNAPSSLTATVVSRSQINLTWTDNSDNETGFKIERCKGSACTNFSQIATVGADVILYSNTRLTKNTTYSYRVRAYNAAGNSGYSGPTNATTLR
jgi:hypothetical protein